MVQDEMARYRTGEPASQRARSSAPNRLRSILNDRAWCLVLVPCLREDKRVWVPMRGGGVEGRGKEGGREGGRGGAD